MKHTLLLLVLLLFCSCFARGGISGELRVNVDVSVADVYRAAVETLGAEQIEILSKKHDAASGLIKARFADETPVTIHCERLTPKASQITVQVGVFGDELRSDALMKKIGQRFPR